ncbi:methyl-accepting chemotaxis protein [Microseira wollei]|uniref:Methyl-accepting chemotaxis sensory transducer n=1 Tax=Microseira wollei NIES-4236 TaxID=2530354 RepID=A0AAV3WJE3_9CYAN|nr:methyl-accepting chemotaxis protein [Microseira wollei]GET40149.1 methyl-accepting chemotaxis sensory transducer [Microseira wollei NIES-4236]
MPYQSFWNALICGGITALATATTTYTLPGAAFNPTEKGYIAGTAGAASFIVSLGLESYLSNRMRRQVKDMRSQMESLCQGNYPARARVYSQDELGQLATKFNQMAVVVEKMMDDFDGQVQTWEYDSQNITRQVLVLEEAIKSWANGDFTVTTRAKLPEELGVVAYGLNLIALSLQERVRQVKTSAQKVAQEVTNSENIAKFFAAYPLPQVQQLTPAVNSIEAMTDSLQRVALNGREVEQLAEVTASTALNGDEVAQQSAAQIVQIQEFLGTTPPKIKRLGEFLPELSDYVADVSGNASRINLLALNASIEATGVGDKGKQMAKVAHNLQQLSNGFLQSLQQIEQITKQMQDDITSVMNAMQAETQQVTDCTNLAQEVKQSLEDILNVKQQWDVVAPAITDDTQQLDQTARSLAATIQTVEFKPQDTSKEAAQKASENLQNLVKVAQDLLTSVEELRIS